MITKVYLYENTQSGGFQKFCISNSIMKRTILVRTAPVRPKPGILSSSSEYGRLTQGQPRKRAGSSFTRSRSGMKSRYRAGTARPQRVESSGKVLPAQRWFCSCKPLPAARLVRPPGYLGRVFTCVFDCARGAPFRPSACLVWASSCLGRTKPSVFAF